MISGPLSCMVLFNVYKNLINNELLVDYFYFLNYKFKNLLNVLFCNLCCFIMNKVIKIQYKIKIYEKIEDKFDI